MENGETRSEKWNKTGILKGSPVACLFQQKGVRDGQWRREHVERPGLELEMQVTALSLLLNSS